MALRKDKPVYDEQMLAKVLEAAYVLQEHGQELRALKADEGAAGNPKETASVTKPASVAKADLKSGGAISAADSVFICRSCGHELLSEEQFCGKCGTARGTDDDSGSLQSKVASLWQMQERQGATSIMSTNLESAPAARVDVRRPKKGNSADFSDESSVDHPEREVVEEPVLEAEFVELGEPSGIAPETASVAITTAPGAEVVLTSAASARSFLENLAASQRRGPIARFWNDHRGDVYLVVAIALVIFAIRWSMTPRPADLAATRAAAAAHHKPAPDADLSFFDKALIALGIAEAPDTAEDRDKGNPDVQVWVDIQAGQYYCPGADLYGKTPKGKFTSQRDAQLDQFEPAYRKACH